MAFTSIPDSIIQVGKAITRTLWKTYVKDSLDDLNTRTLGLESTAGKIFVYDEIVKNTSSMSSYAGLDIWRAPAGFSLTDAKIYIFTVGALTGTLEMDIKKSSSPDFTAAVSVFTTKPSIDFSTASDYDVSTNAVFDSTNKIISTGDYLKLDMTSMPSNGIVGQFGVYLIGEAS